MDFELNESQRHFGDSARALLADIWGPGRVRALVEGELSEDGLWSGLKDLGFHAALVPERFGGLGLDFADIVLMFEEFGRFLVTSAAPETAAIAAAIARHGNPAQKQRLLPRLADGGLAMSYAAQPGGSGKPGPVKAHGNPSGWTLEGRAILVPHADKAGAFAVRAELDDGSAGLFLVEAQPDRMEIRRHAAIDPSASLHIVDFKGLAADTEALVEEGAAMDAYLRNAGAFSAAAQLVGAASASLEIATEYAKTREQFGKRIGSFQAIKHRLADMAVELDAATVSVRHAAWALSQDSSADLAVSLAKAVCSDAGRRIISQSLHILGGIGFTWEHDIHFYLKRGKIHEAAYGCAKWHRERIATALLADPAVALNG